MPLYISGLFVSLMIFIPNILFIKFPPNNLSQIENKGKSFRMFELSEKLGQIGYSLLPAFIGVNFVDNFDSTAITGMIVTLLFYYVGWIRYLVKGRDYYCLFSPMLGIPVPMAISPILYFGFYALGMQSWAMGFIVLLFAVGHLFISHNTYKNLIHINGKTSTNNYHSSNR